MIELFVPLGVEQWDEEKQEFIYPKVQKLQLEHSLLSISKWESKWCKPFLSKQEKTSEETLDYIKCMTLTSPNPDVYSYLTVPMVDKISQYINAPMTAKKFSENGPAKRSQEQITSELIYYQMIALHIPFECQKWHLNRLLTLIRVCAIKSQPPKKMSTREVMRRNTTLNAARRKKFKTKG